MSTQCHVITREPYVFFQCHWNFLLKWAWIHGQCCVWEQVHRCFTYTDYFTVIPPFPTFSLIFNSEARRRDEGAASWGKSGALQSALLLLHTSSVTVCANWQPHHRSLPESSVPSVSIQLNLLANRSSKGLGSWWNSGDDTLLVQPGTRAVAKNGWFLWRRSPGLTWTSMAGVWLLPSSTQAALSSNLADV